MEWYLQIIPLEKNKLCSVIHELLLQHRAIYSGKKTSIIHWD